MAAASADVGGESFQDDADAKKYIAKDPSPAGLDAGSDPLFDPCLRPFLDDGFVPRAWFFRHVELGGVVALAVLQALLPRPTTMALVLAKGTLSVLVVAVLAAAVVYLRPYARGESREGVLVAWEGLAPS